VAQGRLVCMLILVIRTLKSLQTLIHLLDQYWLHHSMHKRAQITPSQILIYTYHVALYAYGRVVLTYPRNCGNRAINGAGLCILRTYTILKARIFTTYAQSPWISIQHAYNSVAGLTREAFKLTCPQAIQTVTLRGMDSNGVQS